MRAFLQKEILRDLHAAFILSVLLVALIAIPATSYLIQSPQRIETTAIEEDYALETLKKEPEFFSDELLVKFKKTTRDKLKEGNPQDTGIPSLDNVFKKHQVRNFQKVAKEGKNSVRDADIFSWYKVTFDEKQEKITAKNLSSSKLQLLIEDILTDPNVEKAEPNFIVYASSNVPNDPYYSSTGSWGQTYPDLWGLKRIQPENAWDLVTGSEQMTVAVIDSGVDYNHSDIAANIWANSDELPENNIDDDSNGFIDDVRGWDFTGSDNNPMDEYGHGSHVAGVIGAVGNNGIGIVGVNWTVRIMPVRFLDFEGKGATTHAALGIVYAVDNGAKVLNNSWVGAGVSSMVQDAVNYAHDVKGAVVVAAAGNSNMEVSGFFPANELNAITVSASDTYDSRAGFSNWGPKIDVAAPGWDILSLKSAIYPLCTGSRIVGGNYCRASGTSVAAPFVSGLAALILAQHPEFTNEEVRQVLRVSADDIETPGFDIESGRGRINAAQALVLNQVLTAQITKPNFPVDLVSLQTLDIYGTASGPGFTSYQLSYGVSLAPTDWIPISSSSTPVTNGLLGRWEVGGFGPGSYLLKLAATDEKGLTYDAYISLSKERWVRAITTGVASRGRPRIDNVQIVWADTRYGDTDIFLYNLTNNREQRITTNLLSQSYPDISGQKIVWIDNRNGNWDIYLYDLATNTERQITTSPTHEVSPSISGDKIVWQDNRNGNWDIYLYDLATNTERQITTSPTNDLSPDILDQKIVWIDSRNGNWDIYLYDLATNTERQIAAGPPSQDSPSISENTIIWLEIRTLVREIFLYDLITNSERQIPSSGFYKGYASISGKKIVWHEARNVRSDIFLYDLATDTENQIVLNLADQISPSISGDRVAWVDYRDSLIGNIYLYEPPKPPCESFGDIDNSGLITKSDSTLISQYIKYIKSTTSLSEEQRQRADVDGNIEIAEGDASLVLQYADGVITTFPVCEDTQAPTVSLIDPPNGSLVTGEITIKATASDNLGVLRVEFYRDGITLLGTDTTSPYETSWDTKTVADGTYSLTAKAYDVRNNVGNSSPVTITVSNIISDTTPPTISIISPADGSIVLRRGTVIITASATDNVGVTKVEFSVNGRLTCTDNTSPYTCSWKVPGKPNTKYTLTAKAYDAAGNTASASVNVTSTR